MSGVNELRPWSQMPWLDLRCSELCRTTSYAGRAVYQAARLLWAAGVPDEKAADILVSADSAAGQAVGIVAYVASVLNVIEHTWVPDRRSSQILAALDEGEQP